MALSPLVCFAGFAQALVAMMTAPAAIRPMPSHPVTDGRSPRNAKANSATSTTLSLSIGATIDAGPHVKVIVRASDAAFVGTWMRAVPGVLRVIECAPGEGARIEESGAA